MRRHDPYDGRLHYGSRYTPCICGGCLWWLRSWTTDTVGWCRHIGRTKMDCSAQTTCHVVTATGRSRFCSVDSA